MFDAKIFSISFSASKTLLANYLFDDFGNGTMELLKGEQLEHIQDKFCELSSLSVRNLIASFRHHSKGGYIDSIFESKSKSRYNYIQDCYFPKHIHGQKVFVFKMSINGVENGVNFIT